MNLQAIARIMFQLPPDRWIALNWVRVEWDQYGGWASFRSENSEDLRIEWFSICYVEKRSTLFQKIKKDIG